MTDFEALSGLFDDKLNLGSPERPERPESLDSFKRAIVVPEPKTVQKIKFKLKPNSQLKSPSPKSEDVSYETSLPVLHLGDTTDALIQTQLVLPLIEQNEASKTSLSEKPSVRKIRMKKSQLPKTAVVTESVKESSIPVSSTDENIAVDEIISAFIRGIFTDIEEVDSQNGKASPPNKWTKQICFDSSLTKWKDYRKKDFFKRVAWIVPDMEVVEEAPKTKKGKGKSSAKQVGDKKRQTLIQFVNTISIELWRESVEWIYILVIGGYIVKIGGTRVGLDERCKSYLSGHCVPEKGGKSVSTNAFIYHTFHWYLEQGMSIEMYGFRIEPKQDTDTMLGFTETYFFSRFHVWESLLLDEFEKLYGRKPPLSSNSDPKYRK
jgi:hypothetical protein